MELGAFVFTAHQVVEVVVVRCQMPVGVHRNEAGVLQKARIDAPPIARVVHRHAVDHVVLEPFVGLVHREVVDGRGAETRVDRAAHHRHRARRDFALGGHQRNGGQHRHRGLADRNHVHFGAHVADELLHVGHIVVEVERTRLKRHHARIGPVGDVDLVVLQQRANGFAQQGGMVARQRCHHQHGGLVLHAGQRGGFVGEALEAQQSAEGFGHRDLFLHRDFGAVHLDRGDAEGRLLVVLRQTVHQAQPGRHALRHRRVRERGQRVVVQLRGSAGEVGERAQQRALGFIELVQHESVLGLGFSNGRSRGH